MPINCGLRTWPEEFSEPSASNWTRESSALRVLRHKGATTPPNNRARAEPMKSN